MAAFRHHLKLWAIWILLVSSLLMANPLGKLGWVELLATLAPLAMLIDRRIGREPALAFGLPALTLMWLADPASPSILRLLVAWFVFGGGVLLAWRTINSQSELEAIAGQVAFNPPDTAASAQFRLALERELGRARRHERPFALLSASARPSSLEADASGIIRSALLRSLAENRARLELRDFLRAELHIYSEVALDDSCVLALVPEIEHDTLEVLLERLKNAADEQFDFDIQIGAGCFPLDAVSADELIAAADRNRKASKLRSLPERVVGIGIDDASRLSPDVQG
jgi:hypothetical protein